MLLWFWDSLSEIRQAFGLAQIRLGFWSCTNSPRLFGLAQIHQGFKGFKSWQGFLAGHCCCTCQTGVVSFQWLSYIVRDLICPDVMWICMSNSSLFNGCEVLLTLSNLLIWIGKNYVWFSIGYVDCLNTITLHGNNFLIGKWHLRSKKMLVCNMWFSYYDLTELKFQCYW